MLERIKQVDRRQALAWLLIVAGAVAGLIGWIGVSGRDVEALQLPFLASGGIAALILTAVGAALLISSDVRADRERAGRLEAEVLELQDLVRDLSSRLDGNARSSSTSRRAGRAS
jgi:Kef-type K+ transport system membrane component KefB